MWQDPIVEEVRQIRDLHAAKFDYDIDAIFRDLIAYQEKNGLKVVSFPPKPAKLIEPAAAK